MKTIRIVASKDRIVPLEDGSKVGAEPVSVRSSHYVRQLIACGALDVLPEEPGPASVLTPDPDAAPPAKSEGADASTSDVLPPRANTLQQGIEDAVRTDVSPAPRTSTRNKA